MHVGGDLLRRDRRCSVPFWRGTVQPLGSTSNRCPQVSIRSALIIVPLPHRTPLTLPGVGVHVRQVVVPLDLDRRLLMGVDERGRDAERAVVLLDRLRVVGRHRRSTRGSRSNPGRRLPSPARPTRAGRAVGGRAGCRDGRWVPPVVLLRRVAVSRSACEVLLPSVRLLVRAGGVRAAIAQTRPMSSADTAGSAMTSE